MKEPGYVEETLRWCNARRKEQGKEPLDKLPKGVRGKGTSCPCGAATGLFVAVSQYWEITNVATRIIQSKKFLPRSVTRFVMAFDRGRLPQYDIDA